MFYIRKSVILRSLALFTLINILSQVVFPAVSYALTAGPTSPEFNSFEPIDASDLVNPATGDMTYNIPLIEVPGPEGGYPLALSYHAGIAPDQEASWVGLGWSLNPGAINRLVSYFPDDMAGSVRTVHDDWNGGERSAFSVGVGVCGVSMGMTFANDTYKGAGVGLDFGLRYNYLIFSGSAGVNGDPYGNVTPRASVGVGASYGESLSAEVGIKTNFETVTAYGTATVGVISGYIDGNGEKSVSIMGASIYADSKGITGVGFMGSTIGNSQVNNKYGKISSYSSSMGVSIPIYVVKLDLGSAYQRYWSDERSDVLAYGTLNPDLASNRFNGVGNASNSAFDSYSLIDPDSETNIVGEADKQLGGSFPAYDNYAVTGQGLSGYIQPYIFEDGSLFRQNVDNNGTKITYANNKSFNKKARFRFKNDFSNTIERKNGVLTANAKGFNISTNHLAGSRHVEWFTNLQIVSGQAKNAGFVAEPNHAIVVQGKNVEQQLGGFMITNESGVTYHYALPVYAYDEYQKFTSKPKIGGIANREYINKQPYAYTWLLTSITGPDYVDRGSDGLDDDDYGYWVRFRHGMWADGYRWRNPFTGTRKDIDKETEFYSSGKKEVYYLDAIETRSHVAVFVKDIRKDGLSVGSRALGGISPQYSSGGGFIQFYGEFPIMSLKLNKVMLFQKDVFKSLSASGLSVNAIKQAGLASHNYTFEKIVGSGNFEYINHFDEKVITEDDIATIPNIQSKVLRQVDFETDYSLCGKTVNSQFDISKSIYAFGYPIVQPALDAYTGKLTLKSLTFSGKGGPSKEAPIPPISFKYGDKAPCENSLCETGQCVDGYCEVFNKNPDYDADKADIWGNYKSDVNKTLLTTNENAGRVVSPVSAKSVDAWSLTEVTTSLGAKVKIEYESDSYESVELAKQHLFRINNVTSIGGNKIRITLFNDEMANLKDYYQVNDKFDLRLIQAYNLKKPSHFDGSSCSLLDAITITSSDFLKQLRRYVVQADKLVITAIDEVNNTIEVDDISLKNQITAERKITGFQVSNPAWMHTCDEGHVSVNFKFVGWPDYIVGGIITAPARLAYGGGLRTKRVSVIDNVANEKYTTQYEYTGGSTSYEPFGLLSLQLNQNYLDNEPADHLGVKLFKQEVFKLYNKLIANARELPGPGVFYKKTTITEFVTKDGIERQLPTKRTYEFDLFDVDDDANNDGVADKPMFVFNPHPSVLGNHSESRQIDIYDYSSRACLLKKTTNAKLDNSIIDQQSYTYLHDQYTANDLINQALGTKFNNQGLIHQMFRENRVVAGVGNQEIVSNRYEYPVVLVKEKFESNYNGLSSESENLAFDFYTGKVVKSVKKDAYGNVFLKETTPSHNIAAYSGMGLKVHNINNAHMLDQVAQVQVYKVDPADYTTKLGLVSSQVTIWSKNIPVLGIAPGDEGQDKIWRKYQSYSWVGDGTSATLRGDGTYSMTDYNLHQFNFITPSTDKRWQKQSELTLIDQYSNVLASKDMNGRSAAIKMDNQSRFVTVSATNASFAEFAYSGAELYSNANTAMGGVSNGGGIISPYSSHTGANCLLVSSGSTGFTYTLDKTQANVNKPYRASVWVYMPGFAENDLSTVELVCKINNVKQTSATVVKGTSKPVLVKKAGSWYQLMVTIIPPAGNDQSIEFSCVNNNNTRSVYFDDFKVSPLNANTTSYVYDSQTTELTHIIDNNNFYTRYVYDESGKLKKIYKELFQVAEKPVAEMKMNYGNK